MIYFLQHHPYNYKRLTSTTNSWHRHKGMEHQKLGKSLLTFFLYLVLQIRRNYKTRKKLLLRCMYRYTFNNFTTSKAGIILYLDCKTKIWWSWLKYTPLLLLANLSKLNMWFWIPIMSHCFQRLVNTYHWWLCFLKACQRVLIKNIILDL